MKIRYYIQITLGAASAVIIYKLFKAYDFSVLSAVTLRTIIILSGITIIGLSMGPFYVKYLLWSFSIKVPFRKIMTIFIVTQLAGYLRGAIIGPLTVIYFRKRISGIMYRESLFISIIESVIRFVILITLAIIGVIIIFGNRYVSIGLLALGFIGLLFLLLVNIADTVSTFFMNKKIFRVLYVHWKFLKKIVRSIDVKSLLLAVGINLSISLLCAGILSVLLHSFHYRYSILVVWCINVMSILVGIFSLLPLGLGTQDLTGIWLLMTIGVDKNSALSCLLLYRIFTTLIPITTVLILGNISVWKINLLGKPDV